MSGLCDLLDFPADQRVAIARAFRNYVSMPATAPVTPLVAHPLEPAVAGALSSEDTA